MTHLKQPLRRMRPAFRHDLLILCLAVMISVCSGCSKEPEQTLLLGEWIRMMTESAGIESAGSEVPYFLNVGSDSPYFTSVQAAVDWGILTPDYPFDPEQKLDRRWTAFTLVRLAGLSASEESLPIRDIGSDPFRREIVTAAARGLMDTDKNSCFHPEAVIAVSEAEELLEQVLAYMDTCHAEGKTAEIKWNEEAEITAAEAKAFDKETMTARFSKEDVLKPGQYVSITENGEESLYRIDGITEGEDDQTAFLEPARAEELIEDLELENEFTVDFTQAEITDLFHNQIPPESSYVEPVNIHLMSARPLTRSMTVNGYTVSYSVTAAGIRAGVSRNMTDHEQLAAELELCRLKPVYRWKMHHGKVEEGYLRLDFTTLESLSFRSRHAQQKYGDLSQIDSSDFPGMIRNLFQDEKTVMTVPLCEVKIPLPDIPMLYLDIVLQLKMHVTGRVELALSQDHKIGMEIHHQAMRTINEHDSKAEASIQADTGVTGNLLFGLNLQKLKLADVSAEAGAKANLSTVMHLYDSEGNHTVTQTDLPADYVGDMAEGNGNVLVCTDMNAYWVSNLTLNSGGTLAGRLGFGKSVHLLDEKTGKLFPGKSTHIENGHFVDHCTRGGRSRKQDRQKPDADQLDLGGYSLILAPDETKTVSLKSLPEGYHASDIRYESLDPAIASVDAGGRVTGISEGSTIIRILTDDDVYRMQCSVTVRNRKAE